MQHLTGRMVPALVLTGLLLALTRAWGPLPPIGAFLDPAFGAWSVARAAKLPAEWRADVPGLRDSVIVVYDHRAVPHIFATTLQDARRALGYVVARDRLFQLELQARATAGRLTEWAGAAALGLDRAARQLGLALAAEEEYERMVAGADPVAEGILAFADGVNAWLADLPPAARPLEYHLLGVEPAAWRPVYSLYLLKRMSWTLSFSTLDRRHAEVVRLVGPEAARALMPRNSAIQEPVVPNGLGAPRFEFPELPAPADPAAMADVSWPSWLDAEPDAGTELRQASNNWAVAPSRTASGVALLAGDPHLGLTLPAIWYEVHQVVPDSLDVYGAALVGTPTVVIGFNREVAWSFTNNGADVVDFYREVVDDETLPRRTRLDDAWVEVEQRVESFYGRSGDLVAQDTMLRSHRGPLLPDDGGWISMRWMALEPARTASALDGMNQAESVTDWLAAAELFDGPSQSGIVADRAGNIAIRSLGQVPRRPPGAYRFLWDGTSSASDWRGAYPVDRLPQSLNPDRGYLASANQQPVDPRMDSTYWGRAWPTPWRAMRINEALRQDSTVTVDEMRRLQTDPASTRAAFFIPYLLGAAVQGGEDNAAVAGTLLSSWDGRYTASNERAILFDLTMEEIQDRVWDELRVDDRRVYTPPEAILAQLMEHPRSPWWDNRATEPTEDRDAILRASLAAGYERAVSRYGLPEDGGWRWDRIRQFHIPHLLRLPGLGAVAVPNQGGPSTLSPMALRGNHGASWRMVVELGDSIRAWTTYPGGQSGNPASSHYGDRLAQWSNGALTEVHLPATAAALRASSRIARLVLVPEAD